MPRTRPRNRPALWSSLTLATVLAAAAPAPAADDFVTQSLAREVIGPGQTLAEVADYADNLTPRMPEVKTAAEWDAFAARTRAAVHERVIFRGEAAAWSDAKGKVEWLETLEGGPGYKVKKLRYEALPGLWIPALLYEPDGLKAKGKAAVPAVLNVNGHDAKGKAADYKQIRCINQAKRGMLALNVEWLGMGQLRSDSNRHDLINHIDLTGAGGIAAHYLAMTRALDLLLAIEQTDPERVAVTGLSGGGWQTIFVSAFDPRVKLTNPVAGYSSNRTRVRVLADLGDSEQTPCDLASVTDYAVMTAMMAPRPTLLTFNAKDNCCFAAPTALPPLLEAAGPVFKLYGKEANLRSHVNHDPGTHNYLLDNRQANYRMLGDHFFAGDAAFDAKEIPSDKEVKTAEDLQVELPADNRSLASVALDLSKPLPLDGAFPTDKAAATAWRDARKAKLREVVRAKRHEARVASNKSEEKDGVKATFWRLNVGGWSVPVVELVKTAGEPKGTALFLADKGRKESAEAVRGLLDSGRRVLAVDPFYYGEAKPTDHDYLWALMLASVGDRPLGLQATQVVAVARWAQGERKLGPVTLVSEGPRAGVTALVAAGLEDGAVAGVELRAPLGSLKELIETKAAYPSSPELFAFGLLRDFDVPQLAALVAPRPLAVDAAGPRARKELAGLKGWYATWGVEAEPLR